MFFLLRAQRIRDEAQAAWIAADDAWQAELVREHGHEASARRYQPAGRGTPRLERLHRAAEDAKARYRAAKSACDKLEAQSRCAA